MVRGVGTPQGVCTIGDAVVDVIVELARPQVVDDDVPARITVAGGGQAANVAAWCAALGARSAVVSCLGDDMAGELVRSMLEGRGVAVLGPRAAGSTGAIVSIVTPDGKRTMGSDRGTSSRLTAAEIEPSFLDDCDWLHVSGYSLFGPNGGEAALALARMARARGATVSVDLSAATVVEECGALEAARRVSAAGADVAFANDAELEAIGLLEVPVVALKRGAAGCRIIDAGGSKDFPVPAGTVVVDTTGAGDAFAAGFILGGPRLALLAAQACIAARGAMPVGEAAISRQGAV